MYKYYYKYNQLCTSINIRSRHNKECVNVKGGRPPVRINVAWIHFAHVPVSHQMNLAEENIDLKKKMIFLLVNACHTGKIQLMKILELNSPGYL